MTLKNLEISEKQNWELKIHIYRDVREKEQREVGDDD